MTPRQADKVIREGKLVMVQDRYGDKFTRVFTHRDARIIYSSDGGAFERTDLHLFMFQD